MFSEEAISGFAHRYTEALSSMELNGVDNKVR